MSLAALIDERLKEAMKSRNTAQLDTLRLLKSAVRYAAMEKHGAGAQPSDEEVIQVIRKEVKKRQDAIESFEKGGRHDAAAKESAEKLYLETFLPQPLSVAELEALVRAAIEETGASGKAQMGAVMKAATARAGGRTDGKTLNAVVARLLG